MDVTTAYARTEAQKKISELFRLTKDEITTDHSDPPQKVRYLTFEFDTEKNNMGDGNFKITFVCDENNDIAVVDYEGY